MEIHHVAISYSTPDGPVLVNGDLSEDDLSKVLMMLDGATFEDLFMEQVEKEEWHR